ncbi:Flp family type IVb pilin [Acetobacter pasteurianus]
MILKKVKKEVGATAIEYGILSALIGVATITGLQLTGVKLDNTYCYIATQISKAVGGSGGGCSGSSSRASSSSSSNNSDGSSTDSGNSSKDTSSDASDSSSSSPGPVKYNASQNYSLRDEPSIDYVPSESLDLLNNTVVYGITGITGLYNKYGTPITTPLDLATMFGLQNQYEDYLNATIAFHKSIALNGGNASQESMNAYNTARANLYNAADSYYEKSEYSPQVFVNSPSGVSFSGTDYKTGQNFTTTDTGNDKISDLPNSTGGQFIFTNSTGGQFNIGGQTGFGITFDNPNPQ